jgi:hypothetical protein
MMSLFSRPDGRPRKRLAQRKAEIKTSASAPAASVEGALRSQKGGRGGVARRCEICWLKASPFAAQAREKEIRGAPGRLQMKTGGLDFCPPVSQTLSRAAVRLDQK